MQIGRYKIFHTNTVQVNEKPLLAKKRTSMHSKKLVKKYERLTGVHVETPILDMMKDACQSVQENRMYTRVSTKTRCPGMNKMMCTMKTQE